MLAFIFNVSGSEFAILALLGILLFGRDLPAVGRKVGQTVAHLRRAMNEFKMQMDRDADIREVRKSVDELRRAADLTRLSTEPARMIGSIARDAMREPDADPPAKDAAQDTDIADEPPPRAADETATDAATGTETRDPPQPPNG